MIAMIVIIVITVINNISAGSWGLAVHIQSNDLVSCMVRVSCAHHADAW